MSKPQLLLLYSVFVGLVLSGQLMAADKKIESADAMAPLYLKNDDQWRDFARQLKIAKEIGIDAISVDVWWGLVETTDNQFDWRYYDRVLAEIEAAGLHWAPIMSFHKCGGNVGDDCDFPIPNWIWTKYLDHKAVSDKYDLMYKSEQDHHNGETVSLWLDHIVANEYIDFMNAFEAHFGAKAAITEEINISMGPAGELRYPSYNSHDKGCGYATRGCFQAYSNPARNDFRRYILNKYHSLAGVNQAWNPQPQLENINQIGPPDDGYPANGRAAFFVNTKAYQIQYGKDFLDWYNQALVAHGSRMLTYAIQAFDGAFASKPLGMKMAGVHWMMMDTAPHPRIAEMAAGLIQTSVNLKSRQDGYGYKNVLDMVVSFKQQRHVVFYFTCLEKDNLEWDGSAHAYSLAKDLVFFVAQTAEDRKVTIKGENALSSGVENSHGWKNIENAMAWAYYSGLNVLRINNITDNEIGKQHYRAFIQRFKQK